MDNNVANLIPIGEDGFNYNPICVFPEEVLEKIFNKLHEPEDIHNLINSSPQFWRILESRQTAALFELVLPHFSTLLKTDDLLECRLVCKSWKSAVRYLLHNHPSVRPYNLKNDNIKNPTSIVHSELTEHFRRFLKSVELGMRHIPNIVELKRSMRNHPGNPFVYEKVIALTTTFNITSAPWKQTFKFLKFHGRYITHFKMYFQDYVNSFVQFYKIMQKCLKLLPNLKTLEFDQNPIGDSYEQDMWREHLYHEDDDKSILQKVINKYDLPSLPKLDTLIMVVNEPCKSQYQRMILENLLWNYESHLKKIQVSPVLWFARFVQLDDLRHTLTELHVETKRSQSPLILKLLWTFKGYPTLRKLSFSFDLYTENINFQSIMAALNGIKSVQYLKFYGIGINPILLNENDYKEGKVVPLQNIRTLEIRSILHEFVYDTILAYLPALEYLKIENFHHHSPEGYGDTDDRMFQVFKGLKTRKLYESLIWEKLPCLKEIICSESSLFTWETIRKWRPNRQPGDPTHFVRFTRDRFESLKK